ncbi:MAG: hypothetical protein J2P17_24555 [Mycobacterium sp.]|nr:hypothetical protein [Mycobacterium sp.]
MGALCAAVAIIAVIFPHAGGLGLLGGVPMGLLAYCYRVRVLITATIAAGVVVGAILRLLPLTHLGTRREATMTIALSIAEDALALVLIVLALLLPVSKHKSGSTWRSTWERYLPFFGLVLLALNRVWLVDDVHAGRSYLGQLVTGGRTVVLLAAGGRRSSPRLAAALIGTNMMLYRV